MTSPVVTDGGTSAVDDSLAGMLAEVVHKLQAGERVDLTSYVRRHSSTDWASSRWKTADCFRRAISTQPLATAGW
jgi:hypothetical protein